MSDVPRETPPAPPAPAVAQGVFADRLPLAEAYAARLASDGVVRGLIGPREVPRLWERHLLNCALLAPHLPADARVADIGSGAGLPGLVLAVVRPDLHVTLVEPLLRRVTFLEEVVGELGLGRVEVVRARAEELHRAESVAPGFDVVTSRAVAPLPTLLDWCMPLVAPGGRMVALKGSRATEEVAEARDSLAAWRCAPPEVLHLALPTEERPAEEVPPTTAVVVAWARPDAVSWPARRSGTTSGKPSGAAGRRRAARRHPPGRG